MKFDCGYPRNIRNDRRWADEKLKIAKTPMKMFALFPKRVGDRTCLWLETVYVYYPDAEAYWDYDYTGKWHIFYAKPVYRKSL